MRGANWRQWFDHAGSNLEEMGDMMVAGNDQLLDAIRQSDDDIYLIGQDMNILFDYTQFFIYFTFFKGLKTMGILYGGKS